MSFIVGALVGAAVGGTIKGIGAMGQAGNVASGRQAAYDIFQERKGLLGQAHVQSYKEAELGYEGAQSQFRGAMGDISRGLGTGIRDIKATGDVSRSQSRLATSGTINQKVGIQSGDLMAKYKSDTANLFESRDLAKKTMELSQSRADIQKTEGILSAEDMYQNTLSGLDQQPTDFWGGFFS